jgi:DUF1680 family protein
MPHTCPVVVVDTTLSSHAVLRPVPLTAVTLTDDFWQPRRDANRTRTIPTQHAKLESSGALGNFRRAVGKQDGPFVGFIFADSDVYKWLEAAASVIATDPDPALDRQMDDVIATVATAQRPDGYLNTHFALDKADLRYTNIKDAHELYCAGHLFQAAVAHHRATGKTNLLDIATRFADHLAATFGPGGRLVAPGHEEVEMALVELARTTGRSDYTSLAARFIGARGQNLAGGDPYHQDHVPFADLAEVTGHAVRAVYLACGAADVVAETGEPAFLAPLERQWHNMIARRSYVTGGIGARHDLESFGVDYELPNSRAYTETCAAVGSVMWAHRMLALAGDARYADVMEWTLYNGVLPGLSLDGEHYFYENPLADDGTHRRKAWFGCACCPPNVARLLAQLPGYFYATSDGAVWVHLYAAGTVTLSIPNGPAVTIHVATRYPWDGTVEITVDADIEFTLHLRIPAWCESGATAAINGHPVPTPTPGTYLALHRTWAAGDVVRLDLPMPVRHIESHPHVTENAGRIAVARGPIVYCVESPDVADLAIPTDAEWTPTWHPDLLGGVVTLTTTAHLRRPTDWPDTLYRTARPATPTVTPTKVNAIPYYAWANRAADPMRVWLPLAQAGV